MPSRCSAASAARRRALDRIGDGDRAGEPAVDGDEDRPSRPRGGARRPASASGARRRCRARRGTPRCRCATRRPVDGADDALAGRRIEVRPPARSVSPRSSAARDDRRAPADARSPRSTLAARRSSFASLEARPAARSRVTVGLPFGQRAGLVDDQRVDLLHPLQRLGVPDQHAGLRAAADADHDRHRRREAERAGAGDDQHARRRRRGRRRSAAPGPNSAQATKASDRDRDHRRHEPAGDLVGEALDRRAAALRLARPAATIRASSVSRPTFSARMTKPPVRLTSRR